MIGRGMRPGPPIRLLDHTSNWSTIGLPKDDFIFTLDAGNEDAYFKLADEAKKALREKQLDAEPEHVEIGDLVEFNLAKKSHSSSGHKARSKALPKVITDYPTMRYLFVTLALKNCAIGDLRKTIIHLNESFSRLAGIKEFPAVGYMKTVEVARGKSGDCQLRLHVLMGVKASYFGNRYISKKDWCLFWKRSAKVDYTPTIEVQATSPKASPLELLAEIVKWQNKPNDLMFADREWFLEYTKQIKGTKAFASGGIFKDYFKELDKEATTDEMIGNNETQEGVDDCEINLSKSNKFEPYPYIESERDFTELWQARRGDRISTYNPKAAPQGQLALF